MKRIKKGLLVFLTAIIAATALVAITAPAQAASNSCRYKVYDPHLSSTYRDKYDISTVDGKVYVWCYGSRSVVVKSSLWRCAQKPGSLPRMGTIASMAPPWNCRQTFESYRIAKTSKTRRDPITGNVIEGYPLVWVAPNQNQWKKGTGCGWWKVQMDEATWSGNNHYNKWGPWSSKYLCGRGQL